MNGKKLLFKVAEHLTWPQMEINISLRKTLGTGTSKLQ
jgi:hypothetical protein